MIFDWFAAISRDASLARHTELTKRQKLSLDVFPGLNREAKNSAKETARGLVGYWSDAFPYASPGDMQPITSRGAGLVFRWKLKTPFFSRAEGEFDPLDNPLYRDSLTNLPMLRATGAKGMLRSIAARNNPDLARMLFGPPREETENRLAGRIVFGDVFYSGAATDVFSPHERCFGVVDHPVIFEIARPGAEADWGMMLHEMVPGELELKDSMLLLIEAVNELLSDYGMSAKRSSNYGLSHGAVRVLLKAGSAIVFSDLAKKYQQGLQEEYPESEPPLPQLPQLPKWHEAIVEKAKLCSKEDAGKRLSQYEISKEEKTKRVKPQRRKRIKAKWQEKAVELWEECERIIKEIENQDNEENTRLKQAHERWLLEKEQWERSRPVSYEFPSIPDAIKAVNESTEVAYEPS